MTTQPKHEGPLTAAAAAFEHELERYERLTSELGRTPVRSDKSLSRTKRLLSEAAECEEGLGRLLHGLLAAMQGARDKQQTSMERVLEAAHGVQTRASEFTALLERVAELGHKARDGKLSIADLTGGTFTISNGGVYGSLMSTPILNPPQSAILGMHKIQQRPMVVGGEVKVRPMMYLAVSYDHRIIDGREAVLFLVRVKECIEDPERLLLGV